jgi:hypothetical protein
MRSYRLSVSIRTLFALLVGFTVLLGPVLTHASAASAAGPGHHAEMVESGHCKAPPADSSEDEEAQAKSCCVSTCMAIAIAPPTPLTDGELKPVPRLFAVPALHLSYLGEIATPPPRRS